MKVWTIVFRLFIIGCVLACASCAMSEEARWALADNGKPACVIVADLGDESSRIAAGEIRDYLRKVSGANVSVFERDLAKPGAVVIRLSYIKKTDNPFGEEVCVRTSVSGGKKIIEISGATGANLIHAAYAFIERLGVRFFHPEQEFIPKKRTLSVGEINISESPAYKYRGIQQHTLHPIEYTTVFMKDPSSENLLRAYRYIDWLAKNRQNYLYWWWVEKYKIEKLRPYVRKIVEYAHRRGVNVGMVVGMPFNQQGSYNLMRGTACHSDRELWKMRLRNGVDEVASLGVDSICIFFGDNEGSAFSQPEGCAPVDSPVKAVFERIEAVREYAKLRYPKLFITLWVHPSSWIRGDETCPNFFFLPKLAPPDIGASVHTVQHYNLLDPAPTYGNGNFADLRNFLFEQSKVRPVWYWPETAYACGFDVDVPMWFPLYIWSRWVDSDYVRGAAQGHITFSSGLEWMYWLNDYAVARFGWNPQEYSVERVLGDFAAIFEGEARSRVMSAIRATMEANQYYFLTRSADGKFNLMDLLSVGPSGPIAARFAEMKLDDIIKWRDEYMPALQGLEAAYEKAYLSLDEVRGQVSPEAMPWFDELRDSLEATYLRCKHQRAVFSTILKLIIAEKSGARAQMPEIDEAKIARERVRQIMERRERSYRFPAKGFADYMRPLQEWESFAGMVRQYMSAGDIYPEAADGVRGVPLRLAVLGPVGKVTELAIDIPQGFDVGRPLSLLMMIDDTDSELEGVMVVGGKEFPLPASGDRNTIRHRFDFPANTFVHGINKIEFRFNDTAGGRTNGYFIVYPFLAELKK